MSKEEILNQFVIDMKQRLDNVSYLPDYEIIELEETIKAIQLYLKVNSLPKRTINDLQVGDYVEFDYDTRIANYRFKGVITNISKTDKAYPIEINYDCYFCQEDMEKLFIIPHEAIELLKEVIG